MNQLKEWARENRVAAVGVILVAILAGVFLWRQFTRRSNPSLHDTLTQIVTIRDKETGEEFQMPRGRMEQMLWDRPAPVDPNQGIPNPKTGTPTCFPVNEWEETINRINRERADMAGHKPNAGEAKKKGDR